MEINFTSKATVKSTTKGDDIVSEKDFSEMQKDVFRKMHQRVRQEVPQEGNFENIVEEFENPSNNKVFSMEVAPCYAKGSTYKRYLNLGCEIKESPNKLTFCIADGTKQDILDYLGNDSNLNEVNGYYALLEDKVDNL